MFACVTHQLWEQKALTVVLAALLLRQVMKLQQSIDTHEKSPFGYLLNKMTYILSNNFP
jgi:hypothetical protein